MVINIPKEVMVTRCELGTKFIASAVFVINRGCMGNYFSHIFFFINSNFMAFSKHFSFALNRNRSYVEKIL